jgi:hypothetical protein
VLPCTVRTCFEEGVQVLTMRWIPTLALASWSALAGCAEGSTVDPGNGSGSAFVYGVSFAGDVRFEQVHKFASDMAIDVQLEHRAADGVALVVRLSIPAGAFLGPGTYACGADPGLPPSEYAYCSITVEHHVDGATYAIWTTQGAPAGVYGPLSGCELVVTQDDADRKAGHVACVGLPFATAFGAHPDAGVDLSIIGDWSYPVL